MISWSYSFFSFFSCNLSIELLKKLNIIIFNQNGSEIMKISMNCINFWFWSWSKNAIQKRDPIKVWNLWSDLEPLKNKNRQMNITNLVLMKNQAVTKVIQMFPPKPRGLVPAASTQFWRPPAGVNEVRTAASRRFYAECQQNGGGNIWMDLVTAWFFINTKLAIFIWRFLICNGSSTDWLFTVTTLVFQQ